MEVSITEELNTWLSCCWDSLGPDEALSPIPDIPASG